MKVINRWYGTSSSKYQLKANNYSRVNALFMYHKISFLSCSRYAWESFLRNIFFDNFVFVLVLLGFVSKWLKQTRVSTFLLFAYRTHLTIQLDTLLNISPSSRLSTLLHFSPMTATNWLAFRWCSFTRFQEQATSHEQKSSFNCEN